MCASLRDPLALMLVRAGCVRQSKYARDDYIGV